MENFKGYVYTILGGLGTLIALIFVALQWRNGSKVTAFGPEVEIRTIWVVLASAAGGVVTLWLMRLLVRGARMLHKVRRRQGSAKPAEDSQMGEKKSPDES